MGFNFVVRFCAHLGRALLSRRFFFFLGSGGVDASFSFRVFSPSGFCRPDWSVLGRQPPVPTGRGLGLARPLWPGVPTPQPSLSPLPRRSRNVRISRMRRPPFASRQSLWDLSAGATFGPFAVASIGVEQPRVSLQPPPIPFHSRSPSFRSMHRWRLTFSPPVF